MKLAQKIGNRFVILAGMLVMAGSFGLLATVTTDSGFTVPAVAPGLLGLGAGMAMPAAVAALMGTVPADKAGVGSALNDTIQQAGTALGIAILGSLLTSSYTAEMPSDAPEQAKESIAGALAVAGPDSGLLHAAREAFTTSMSTAFTLSAIGVLAAAVVATLVMRDSKPEQPAEDAPETRRRTWRRARSRSPDDTEDPRSIRTGGLLAVGLTGFEPVASSLSGMRSNQLSYSPAALCGVCPAR